MKWIVVNVPGNVGVLHKQRVVHHGLNVKEHGDGERGRSQLIEINLPRSSSSSRCFRLRKKRSNRTSGGVAIYLFNNMVRSGPNDFLRTASCFCAHASPVSRLCPKCVTWRVQTPKPPKMKNAPGARANTPLGRSGRNDLIAYANGGDSVDASDSLALLPLRVESLPNSSTDLRIVPFDRSAAPRGRRRYPIVDWVEGYVIAPVSRTRLRSSGRAQTCSRARCSTARRRRCRRRAASSATPPSRPPARR